MANPSLQIGNGKFAIKENDLLGYSSSGTRFFPIPITMTRATLGSRVNPSGLIEDVALLGSELVSCGNFDCADPDAVWTKIGNATIQNGYAELTFDGTTGNQIRQTTLTSGKIYKVQYEILSNTGTDGQVFMNAFSNGTAIDISVGTYTLYLTAINTTFFNFRTLGGTGGSVQIDNVSVKEATIDGLARVDYTDGTGSLLVEPQRTNLITYSEDFSQWSAINGVSVTDNFTESPNGLFNASKLVFNGTSSGRIEVSVTTSGTNTQSVYLKTESGTQNVSIGMSSGSLTQFTITDQWVRYTHTGSGTFPRILCNDATTIYVYGAQLEAGSYPTSYIKTQGATVTRNADLYEKTGISDKINSEEGVLFAEINFGQIDTAAKYICVSDGTTNNRAIFGVEAGVSRVYYFFTNGGSGVVSLNSALSDISIFNKIAIKWKENDFALWVNGVEVGTDTSGTTPSAGTFNSLLFTSGGSSQRFNGKVKQLQIFKTALSDSELATLTTI